MRRRDAFLALIFARWREIYREPEVVTWSIVFPVVLSIALSIAFRNRPAETATVAVVAALENERITRILRNTPGIEVRVVEDAVAAAHALRMGMAAVVVVKDADGVVYRLDPTRPEALLARSRVDDALQRSAGREDPLPTREESVSEAGARYIDFLIPGIIGMNIMGGGMWGVGYHLVDMRIKRLLKRLMATPLRRGDFMLAQMIVRVVFVFAEVGFILTFARLLFGVPVRGSIIAIMFVSGLGGLCFAGLGVLTASRAMTIEKATGLMNVTQMPMFVGSGIFFSAERFPAVIQPFIQALPLTALNDALRSVILEGSGLISQAHEIALLASWGLVSFVLGLRYFRWD
ncbi:MAG: ABC transporter permease [Vicinamibacteria bacterium]|nr:ABC transporter permease [Vicinamibacteria bacterium]